MDEKESPDYEEAKRKGLERFEAFKAETQRIRRAYWASVRAAEDRLGRVCWLYECPYCGKLSSYKHTETCTKIKPVDISMEEKLVRKDDPYNDYTWDYDWLPDERD